MAARAASWAGFELASGTRERLERYARWLSEEAIPSGSLGARETTRLWSRHIGDSLAFAVGWESPPARLVDVGTGGGLPGVPLALLWPETAVTLVDRSQRRVDEIRRLIRILELTNSEAVQGEAIDMHPGWPALVTRATFPPSAALRICSRLLSPTGRAVLGWLRATPNQEDIEGIDAAAAGLGLQAEVVLVPETLLDGPPSLLIIAPRE